MYRLKKARFFVNVDNPLLWFLSAWGVALLAWVTAPADVVYYFVPQGRHISVASFAYLLLFLTFFCLGVMFGRKRNRRGSRFCLSLKTACTDKEIAKRALHLMLSVSRFLILIGTGMIIIQIVCGIRGGSSLWALFKDTGVLREGFQGGIIKGLTILKFISLPGFILATIGHFISKKWRYPSPELNFRFLQALSLITPVFMAILGTRLLVLLWVIPYIYLRLGLMKHLKGRQYDFRRFLKYAVILGMMGMFLFSSGFYLRHYTKVIEGQVAPRAYVDPGKGSFPNYVLLNFVSYPFRTINNGFVIVDYVKEHTFVWRTLRWAYSGFGIEKIDPRNLIRRLKLRLLYLQWMGVGCFGATNSSLPGFMYMDLGWFALTISFLLGFITGQLYYLWLETCLCGWVVLPIILVGLMDSWRTDMIFRSVSVVAIISGLLACIYVERKLSGLLDSNKGKAG